MIGGIDIPIPSRAGATSLEVAVRSIRQFWPTAVFENPQSGDQYNDFWQIPFGVITEVFIYRDKQAFEAWDREGAVPDLYNTMIHAIADVDQVLIVVDEDSDQTKAIVAAIASALRDEILLSPPKRKAA